MQEPSFTFRVHLADAATADTTLQPGGVRRTLQRPEHVGVRLVGLGSRNEPLCGMDLAHMLQACQQNWLNRNIALLFILDLKVVQTIVADSQLRPLKIDTAPLDVHGFLLAQTAFEHQFESQAELQIHFVSEERSSFSNGVNLGHALLVLGADGCKLLYVGADKVQEGTRVGVAVVNCSIAQAEIAQALLVARQILAGELVNERLADTFEEVSTSQVVDLGCFMLSTAFNIFNEFSERAEKTFSIRSFDDLQAGLFRLNSGHEFVSHAIAGLESVGRILAGIFEHLAAAAVITKFEAPVWNLDLLPVYTRHTGARATVARKQCRISSPAVRSLTTPQECDVRIGHKRTSKNGASIRQLATALQRRFCITQVIDYGYTYDASEENPSLSAISSVNSYKISYLLHSAAFVAMADYLFIYLVSGQFLKNQAVCLATGDLALPRVSGLGRAA
jgi:hypothetical protein